MPASATRHRLAATVLLGIAFLAACQSARSPDAQRGAASRDDPPERRYAEHAVPRGPHHIYARDYPGEGPALVLMHGFPDNSRLYDRLVPQLAGRRVITFDFLGWGNSDKPKNYAYTFAGQRDDLDAVIEYFDLPEVSLVAHDAAGPAAVNWALDHPDRTASLTLMNAFYAPAPTLRPPALVALFQLGHLDAPVLGADLTANLAALSEEIARDPVVFEQLFVWQEQRFFARAADADTFIPLFYEQFSGAKSSRAPLLSLASDTIPAVAANLQRLPELARFPRPIRLIWGDRDPDLNSDVARTLLEAVPGAELFILPEAHHNLQIDQPQRVAELLLEVSSPQR
jgi:haloalkane dehalogenase